MHHHCGQQFRLRSGCKKVFKSNAVARMGFYNCCQCATRIPQDHGNSLSQNGSVFQSPSGEKNLPRFFHIDSLAQH
jgi:hypothetical protein